MAGLHNAIITYKQNAISEILNDPVLVQAINSRVDDPEDLIYKNVFPYFHVPETDVETLNYVTVCMDYPEERYTQDIARRIILKICVIVHQDQMETEYGSTRLDFISARIDDIFSNSLKYGHGKLRLLSSFESSLDQFHRYREMIWSAKEMQATC